MRILSVADPTFAEYGRVVKGYPLEGILDVLSKTPMSEGVTYVPKEAALHAAPHAAEIGEALFGGMPYQFGYCNGHNTKLNCLEYHRDSEFNLGATPFVVLLAKLSEMEGNTLDTAKVKAFFVPAGTMIETYATTLHYAPCHTTDAGYRVLIVLPENTNTPFPIGIGANERDKTLFARNKWLIAHPEADEAATAVVGLLGENIDIGAEL